MFNNYSNESLFSINDLDNYLRGERSKLVSQVKEMSFDSLLKSDETEVVKSLLARYTLHPLVLLGGQKKVNANEANITMHSRLDYDGGTHVVKGLYISVEIPFSGNGYLFNCRPSTFTLSGTPSADIESDKIVLKYQTAEKDPEVIKKLWQKDIEEINKYLAWIEKDINDYNNTLEGNIKTLLAQRKNEANENKSLIDAILS